MVTLGRIGTSRDIFFITTRNHLPYDKVDDDPSQEEGPEKTPLVITMIVVVVLQLMKYFIGVGKSLYDGGDKKETNLSFAHQPCIECQAS